MHITQRDFTESINSLRKDAKSILEYEPVTGMLQTLYRDQTQSKTPNS